MRLSDIFKKQKEQIQNQTHIKSQHEDNKSIELKRLEQKQEEKDKISKDVTNKVKDSKAEQVYTELILEIRNLFSSISKNLSIPQDLPCIKHLVDLITQENQEIIALTSRSTPDIYLYGHTVNVTILSVMIGHFYGLERDKVILLGYCAFLHDLGMFRELHLAKKNEVFTIDEYMQIKKHVSLGQYMVRNLSQMTEEVKTFISNIIIQTHERMDGSGYPGQLKGNEINIFARIIAIADVYEALTHPRSHRPAIIPHEAVKMIINQAENSFDEDVVKTFVDHISLYPPGSYIRLNTDEIAKVIGVNFGLPTRPIICIIITPAGKRSEQQQIIDLASSPTLYIKEPIDETKLQLIDKKLALELKAMRWWVKGL